MPSSVRRRSRARVAALLAALVVLVAAVAAVPLLSSVADRLVRQRAAALAKRAGITLRIGAVELGLRPLVTLRDVDVGTGTIRLVRIERIGGHLPLAAVLRGERRPYRLDFRGLQASVRVVDGHPVDLEPILARLRGEASVARSAPQAASKPLQLRIHDATVDVSLAGKGVRWSGDKLRLDHIEVDLSRAGGSVAASLSGAVTGRAHAWLERDKAGAWSARVEAAPELAWRPPASAGVSTAAGLGVEDVRCRGLYWRDDQLEVRGLHVASSAGELRIATLRADLHLRDVSASGVQARIAPARLVKLPLLGPRFAKMAGFGTLGEVSVTARSLRAHNLRTLLASGHGGLELHDGAVHLDAHHSRASVRYARIRRLVALRGDPAQPNVAGVIDVRVVGPTLRLGVLDAARLPSGSAPLVGALARIDRLWTTAQQRLRTTPNTAGWARPAAPALTPAQAKSARLLRAQKRRAASGKPAYTAQFAEATRALPTWIDGAWRKMSQALQAATRQSVTVDMRDGLVTMQAGTLTFGGDRIGLQWRGGVSQPRLSVSLRPVLAGLPGGGIEVQLAGDRAGLQRADVAIHGSAVARMISGLDRRLATGKAPDFSLSATMIAQPSGGGVIRGRVGVRDVGVDWDRFAPGPLTAIAVDAPFEVRWPATLRGLTLHTGHVRFGGTEGEGRGRATLVARLSGGDRPVVDFTFGLPTQDCGELLAALPSAMLPTLGKVSARGTLSAWLDLRLDVAHPYYSELDFALNDKKCRDLKLRDVDVAQFNEPFSRKVNEDGKLLDDVHIGPDSDAWVDLNKLPPWVAYAMITTEDGGFWRHRGLNAFLLNRAIRLDLHYGRFVYGGSTITQQLAKNLFFTRSKFLARKVEELFAVWAMERTLKKPRIIEIYMNAVEFAPHVYGVVRGAMHYFGKRPADLSPLEAAWLGSIKPCPRCGDSAFRHKQYRVWYQTRLLEILTRMHRNAVITDAQFEVEANTVPKFLAWPADKLAPRFAHPVPEQKPAAIRRLDRGRGTKQLPRRG